MMNNKRKKCERLKKKKIKNKQGLYMFVLRPSKDVPNTNSPMYKQTKDFAMTLQINWRIPHIIPTASPVSADTAAINGDMGIKGLK